MGTLEIMEPVAFYLALRTVPGSLDDTYSDGNATGSSARPVYSDAFYATYESY